MKKLLLLSSLFILFGSGVYSQTQAGPPITRDCGMSANFLENLRINHPKLYENIQIKEKEIQSNTRNRSEKTSATVYMIPIVFYLFDNHKSWTVPSGTYDMTDISNNDIIDALDHLNYLFSEDITGNMHDPVIQFCLATEVNGVPLSAANSVDPIGSIYTYSSGTVQIHDVVHEVGAGGLATPGIFRIELEGNFEPTGPESPPVAGDAWSVMTQIMNLSDDHYFRVTVGPRGIGKGSLPTLWSPGGRGVYVSGAFFGGPGCAHCEDLSTGSGGITHQTLAHEAGHYYGLYHTNAGGACAGLPPTCATAGDYVCDTEPRPVATYIGSGNCTAGPDCFGGGSTVDYDNIMDFADGTCNLRFTQGQMDRMESMLLIYYPHSYSDCNLKRAGVPCTEELIYGPYCEGEAIQLPSVTGGTTIFDFMSGPGYVGTDGSITPDDAIAGLYTVIITECGFTRTIEFEIIPCECPFEMSLTATVDSTDCKKFDMNLSFGGGFPGGGYVPIHFMWTVGATGTVAQTLIDSWYTSPNLVPTLDLSTLTYPVSGSQEICFLIWLSNLPSHEITHYCYVCVDVEVCDTEGEESLKLPSQIEIHEIDKLATNVFPNPSNGSFALQGTSPGDEIVIVDMLGKVIKASQSTTTIGTEIEMSQYPNGIYFLKVRRNNQVETHKIVVK